MNNVTWLAVVIALVATPFAAPTEAQDHAAHHAAPAPAASASMAEGEVRKIDKVAAKITLRHGEIPSLSMSPMTMVFQVKDKGMLDKVKVGDKVRFAAENAGGALTITAIEPSR